MVHAAPPADITGSVDKSVEATLSRYGPLALRSACLLLFVLAGLAAEGQDDPASGVGKNVVSHGCRNEPIPVAGLKIPFCSGGGTD